VSAPSTDPLPDATEPTVATSGDGELTVIVDPADADVDVSIRVLDPSEWPGPLAGGDESSGAKIYELEPDGTTFREPVTVIRRLPIDAFDTLELGDADVPLMAMLTQNEDGEFELLDDLELLRIGDDVFVSGRTDHFSPAIVTNEQIVLPTGLEQFEDWSPEDQINVYEELARADGSALAVEDGIIQRGKSLWDIAERLDRLLFTGPATDVDSGDDEASADGNGPGVPFVPDEWSDELLISADAVSATVFGDGAGISVDLVGTELVVPLSALPGAAALVDDEDALFAATVAVLQLTVSEERYQELVGEVIPLDTFGLAPGAEWLVIMEVFHRQFGEYPSSLLKRYAGLADALPPGTQAFTTTWEGEVGPEGRLVSLGPLVTEGSDLIGESGIECFCEYREALLLMTAESAPADPNDPNAVYDLVFGDGSDGSARLFELTDPNGPGGESLNFAVTASEGVLFDGAAVLQTVP
jgi:hypothetical protein